MKNIPPFFFKYKITILITLLILFVSALSVFIFAHQSLRLDEAQSLWQTSRSPLKIFNIIAQDVHVPLYHMMLHFWQVAFGNGVATARALSMLFFILSIPAIYSLGKLVYNKNAGLYAALLLAISPFMNWYGNEIRMYSLFTLIVILHEYCFIKLYKTVDPQQRKKYWYLYGIVSVFGIFTHYFFLFSIFSQALFYLFNKDLFQKGDFKKFVTTIIILVIAFSPWIYYVLHLGTISNSSPLLEAPSSVNIFNTFSQFLFGFQIDYVNTIMVSLWPLLVLFGFFGLQRSKKPSVDTMYFITALIVPMALAFIVSSVFRPLYLSRYLILSLPPLYMAIIAFISNLPRPLKKVFEIGLVVIMLGMLFIEAFSALTPVKENYKQATSYLMSNAQPDDAIVVSAPFTIYPVEYYYHGSSTLTTLPIWDRSKYGPVPPFDKATLPDQIATISKDHQNLWLLLSYDQGYQETLRLYFDTHYQRLLVKTFSPGLTLYEYKMRY